MPVDPGAIAGMEQFIGRREESIDEAIAAWRRALTERDLSIAAVALAEPLEFYAAETRVKPLFSPKQLKAMRKAALAALEGQLDPTQIERVGMRVGQLNELPAAARLRAAIDADRVPCNDEEFEPP